jgi:hypothetical protein
MAQGRQVRRPPSVMPQMIMGLLVVVGVAWLSMQAWDMIMMRKQGTVFLDGRADAQSCGDAAIARRAMQRLVLERLESPRSAQFARQGSDRVQTGPDACTFRFTSFVDTKTAYGGDVRTDFRAAIRFDAERGGWRLDTFEQRRR